MTQYVIQILDVATPDFPVGWLAKSFEVTAEYPIPTEIPANRTQVVMTNTSSFNSIVSAYNIYTTTAVFALNSPNIDVSGPITDSWPID